jgi:DNA-binding MarR family transcriptional regulator
MFEPVALTEDHIMSVLLVRRARREVLGENLFSDPAWDILLELYGAKLGDRHVTGSELARAIEAPQSTTTRWIAALQDRGLIERAANGTSVKLSAQGASQMEQLAGKWASAFLAIT